MPLTIGIGGIRYEVNSFAAGRTELNDFERNYIRRGVDVLRAESSTEVFGALGTANRLNVRLVGLLDTFGGCGPLVTHEAYEGLKFEFLSRLNECRDELDAVYLPLHGAMATDRCNDVEADLARAVRTLVGSDMPLIVSQDLHGAPSAALIEACNVLIGFKTCPHVDYEETGAKAIALALAALAPHAELTTVRHPIPMLTPAEGHDTRNGPMAHQMRRFQTKAAAAGLLDASVFMCQPWLDTARTGWCLTAVYDRRSADGTVAAKLLSDQATELWSIRDTLRVKKVSVSEAMQLLVTHNGNGPVLLADGGDSPSAGSTGDSTDLLTALVQLDDPRPRLTVVTDPKAAEILHQIGLGRSASVTIGGGITPGFADPLTVEGTIVALSEGRFVSGYPAGPVNIGPTAALEVGATTIVITTRPAMMLDQQVYRHLGIDPSAAWAVQVKSAGGFRVLWQDVSDNIISVDTRGPSDGNLARLPFRFAPRPLWPLREQEISNTFEMGN